MEKDASGLAPYESGIQEFSVVSGENKMQSSSSAQVTESEGVEIIPEGEDETDIPNAESDSNLKAAIDTKALKERLGTKSGWDAADETNQFQAYMAEKNRKLRAQYDEEKISKRRVMGKTQGDESGLFSKVTVWVNGHTNPSRLQIRRLMMQHGGKMETYYSSKVTHIIADRLAVATLKRHKGMKHNVKYVTSKWVSKSIEQNTRLEEWKFPIPGMSNHGQSSIAKMLVASPKAKFKRNIHGPASSSDKGPSTKK